MLESVGIDDVRLIYTPFAVLVGIVYGYLPLMVFPIYVSLDRLDKRRTLLQQLDDQQRRFDESGPARSHDRFQQMAYSLKPTQIHLRLNRMEPICCKSINLKTSPLIILILSSIFNVAAVCLTL